MKKTIKKICIALYKIIPFNGVKRILKKSGNKIGMYNNIDFNNNSSFMVYDKYTNSYSNSYELNELNKKIAVHLHLYYKDLLDEMIGYLNNIPFKFDLYVSVCDDDSTLLQKFKEISNVNKIVIKVSKNSGRDYGPMMVEFSNKLYNYDYICHIHTKKSLRTGNSQDVWRKHLLDGILGSEKLVRNIFYLFETTNTGVFFQEAPDLPYIPYWGNTWLGVTSLARSVFNEIGVPFKNSYLDFSVGSMFWVRPKAVYQIFSKKWTYKDFGDEKGLNDSTLAYVFEKMFVEVSNYNGYDFICYDKSKKIFLKNFSDRNMHKYYNKNIDTMFERLSKFDIVSFDIFDTLITRKIYSPDDIFNLMGEKLKNNNFINLRKQAEISINSKINPKDPSIHDIYNEYALINNISKEEANKIKDLEISLEKEFLIPRKDMLVLFNKLKASKKRIILISDMYLTSDILSDILKTCGYEGYDKLYVSCEINLRKDRADVWDFIKEKYKDLKIIHIGDNEESDTHLLYENGVECEHILSGKKMYENTTYGHFNKNNALNDNLLDSVINGLIVNNNLFNSPFAFNKSKNEYNINSLFDFGYSIAGPLLLKYLLWVIENSNEETLLFLSREGYYFEKLFDLLTSRLNINIDKTYFLTSRRCITVATLKTKEDVYKLLDIEYYGDMKNFLYYRYGVEYNDKNFDVNLDDDNNKEKVKNVVDKYMDKILAEAKKERANYIKYIDKTIKNYKDKKLCVIDLGYSGTTQFYLSKLLDKKISGKYLVVKNNPKPLSIGCNVESCFNDVKNDSNHLLYKNSLFLECFLTAPNGQLMYFDDKINPVFVDEKLIKGKFIYLNQIYEGVVKLFNDTIDVFGEDIFKYDMNSNIYIENYRAFLLESSIFVNNNKEIFKFEDYYSRNTDIVIEKQN